MIKTSVLALFVLVATSGCGALTGVAAGLDADEGIDHVAIYRDGAPGSVLYDLVLWHVSREDVARLAR